MSTKPTENIRHTKGFSVSGFAALKWYWQWLACSMLAILLYWPILQNGFVSDDHLVLWKVGVEGRLNTDGFFRPLSDITLWITYRLAGLNPFPYYFTGVLIHALNAVMLLQYCLRTARAGRAALQADAGNINRFSSAVQTPLISLLAALLFLFYPFHNEAIAWILGRGALMAGSFTMAAMLVMVGSWKIVAKVSVVCACYFVGLAAYETIIILPLLVLAQLLYTRRGRRRLIVFLVPMLLTLGLHMMVRVWVSGGFMGEYGGSFFDNTGLNKMEAALRAAGRLVLPPSDNTKAMMIAFAAVTIIAVLLIMIVWQKSQRDRHGRRFLVLQLVCLILAMLVPMWLGVSTRTSESDRFLYLPSFFFSSFAACMLVMLMPGKKLFVIVIVLLLYLLFIQLEENNSHWKKASESVRTVIKEAKAIPPDGRLYLINLPSEYEGAFIFRVGFEEALRLYGIDKSRVYVTNRLTRNQWMEVGEINEIKHPGFFRIVKPSSLIIDKRFSPDSLLSSEQFVIMMEQQLENPAFPDEQQFSFPRVAYVQQVRQFLQRNNVEITGLNVIAPVHKKDKVLYWDGKWWRYAD